MTSRRRAPITLRPTAPILGVALLLAGACATAPHDPGEPAPPAPAAAGPGAAAGTAVADPAAHPPGPRVTALADAYVAAYFRHFPDAATVEGRPDADHGRLPDNSLAGLEAWREQEDALLQQLYEVDLEALAPADRLTADFLREVLEASVGRRACETELWEVSPTWTGWQSEYAFLASVQPVGTPELRQAALSRFGQLPRWLEQETAKLREGMRRGYTAPKGNVRRVVEQMDGLLAGPVTGSPFYEPAVRDGDPSFQAALAEIVDDQVRPAITAYRGFLESEYLPAAREEIAVARNRAGADCYRAALRYHTSLSIDPQEVHRLGLEQMERITAEMRVIGRRGFGTEDVRELLARVKAPPYTFSSRQQIVGYAEAAVARAERSLRKWFGIRPRAKVRVVPYPEFRERSAPGGEYQSASDDGSRPGTYYLNTYEPEKQSRAGVEATAFHESYPGHHLQIAIAKERRGTHPVQRYFGTAGFTEGWALYSERLADEMGLYSGDVDRLGLLSNEALRAGRLVVDSGMHALGWTRQQAIDYLLAHTAETEERVASEVDRYIAVPGQATAYMLGNLEIRRLREQAQSQLGRRFEVAEFHDRVLEDGAVTLAMLRGKIGRWLDPERATPRSAGVQQ
jgi:uncharacterized protein (DUF885 family)